MEKTAVEKYLDQQNIAYDPINFGDIVEEAFESELRKRNIEPEIVCKTLVLKGNKSGVIVALLPLMKHLDYKKTRKITKDRKVGFPGMDFVMEHTGYPHGANTPIGIKIQHPNYIFLADQSLKKMKEIVVSSGEIGRSIKISVKDLEAVVQMRYADILTENA